MKLGFLLNASNRWKKFTPQLTRQIANEIPFEKEIFVVNRDEAHSTEKHLRKMIENKFDRIVVAGGDGSLNRVINYLENHKLLDRVALGVIPMGTCNDFARKLGFRPGKPLTAIKAILKNRLKTVRLGKIGRLHFVNNAGFGKKNPSEKGRSAFKIVREMKAVAVQAAWDGNTMEGDFMMMLCANAPYFSGGLRFSRKSDPTDDILEFYFVKKMTKLNLMLRLLFGRVRFPMRLPFSPSILRVQTSRLILKTEQPISIVIDGEPVPELAAARESVFEIASRCQFIVPA